MEIIDTLCVCVCAGVCVMMCMWVVCVCVPKVCFIIQEITSKLDDGNIIERQEIFTKETWWVNRYSLQQKSLNAWNNIFINLKKGKKLNSLTKMKNLLMIK